MFGYSRTYFYYETEIVYEEKAAKKFLKEQFLEALELLTAELEKITMDPLTWEPKYPRQWRNALYSPALSGDLGAAPARRATRARPKDASSSRTAGSLPDTLRGSSATSRP